MKKIYLIAFLFSTLISSSFSQKTDTLQSPNIVTPNASFQSIVNVVPPSPDAASLGKYGEIPVSLYTGTPSIDIPLYEINRAVRVPISLSYHASGVKVDEIASMVGMGWVLNAGGVITKTIHGMPDDILGGLQTTDGRNKFNQYRTNTMTYAESQLYEKDVLNGGYDTEPDEYYYNFLGRSGKMVFDELNNPVLLGEQWLKITIISSGFMITDEQGTKYFFTEKETTRPTTYCLTKNVNYTATMAWYLAKIEPIAGSIITFDYYTRSNISYKQGLNQTNRYVITPESNCSDDIQSPCTSVYRATVKQLQKISFDLGEINFTYENRGDLGTGWYRLKEFEVRNLSNDLIKKIGLIYQYSTFVTGSLPERYILTEVNDLTDSSLPTQHKMEYYHFDDLPLRNSNAQDHWGFYNNNIASSMIPQIPLSRVFEWADREPDAEKSKYGILTKITYPTGGNTVFDYEAHDFGYFKTNEAANLVENTGGVRIKKMTHSDGINPTQIRRYQYRMNSNTNRSSGCLISKPVYHYSYQDSRFVTEINGYVTCNFLVASSSSQAYANSTQGSHVGYEEVTEYSEEGTALNGKTWHKFSSYRQLPDVGNTSIFPFPPPTSYDGARGQLEQNSVFRYESENFVLAKKTVNAYDLMVQSDVQGLKLMKSFEEQGGYHVVENVPYFYKKLWSPLIQTQEFLYDNTGVNVIETKDIFEYNAAQQISKTTAITSKGEQINTVLKYPQDLSDVISVEMVSKNIIAPIVEKTTSLFNPVSLISTQMDYEKTTFNKFYGAFYLPQKIEVKIGSGTLQTLIDVESYDTRGNLTKYKTRDAQTTVLDWYTVAENKNNLLKSKTIGGGNTGTVLQRTMFYDHKPLVGLIANTDINGYASSFQYDNLNRLKSIKDPHNYLLKDFNYHYANQTALLGLGVTPTNTMNYVINRTAREAQTGTALDPDVDKTTTQLQYLDGLGRNLQGLTWKASPDKTKDILSGLNVYDAYGRAYKSILPTPSDAVTGAYKSNAESLASAFYGDSSPSTETVFESSPLNRPQKQFGVGQAWRTANKYVNIQYLLAGGGILKFDVNTDGSVSCGLSYPLSSLFNTCTESERSIQTYELKDKQGRVTHKFQQMDAGFAITAYCYNNLGQIYAVIPPEVYNKMGAVTDGKIPSFTESDVLFKEGIYGYHYDGLGRQIEKHIPGAGWEYFCYDKQDREVMHTDDSDKAKDYWQWVKYDALGRKIQSGIKTGIGIVNRAALQTAFDGMTTETYEETGTALLGYTNRSFPSDYEIEDADVKEVLYYDNYGFNNDVNYNFQSANAFHTQGLTKGLITGKLFRNIKTNTWQKEIMYYDYRGKIIQDFHLSNKGNIIRKDYQFRFNGELLKLRVTKGSTTKLFVYEYDHISRKTKFKHSINGVLQNVTSYFYDPIGRLAKKSYQASDVVSSKQTGNWTDLSTWLSNSLPTVSDMVTINSGQTITIPTGESASAGKLVDNGILKNFGTLNFGKSSANPLYETTYKYHIRNGLKGINTDANNDLTNSLFSFRLDYETDGTYFDGNIRNQYWKSSIDGIKRAYEYSYDGASRLIGANYGSDKAGENYALNAVTYDFNGNIKTLSRNGLKSNNTFGLIDNLNYTYNENSNRLLKVDDGSNETASFKDITGNDYTYWLDGSLKSDNNKSISQIDYNYLKLPQKINLTNGNWIEYEYDAEGTKLKKTLSTGKVTDYEEDDIYENGILYQTVHDEGRIIDGIYEYNITDHLGNLRVAFKDSSGIAKITQVNAYGAFGDDLLTLKYVNSLKKNRFGFNLKEEENDFGIGYTDFKWRFSDQILGRFFTIDRLAEKYSDISTYQFASNDPINKLEIDGLEGIRHDEIITNGSGKPTTKIIADINIFVGLSSTGYSKDDIPIIKSNLNNQYNQGFKVDGKEVNFNFNIQSFDADKVSVKDKAKELLKDSKVDGVRNGVPVTAVTSMAIAQDGTMSVGHQGSTNVNGTRVSSKADDIRHTETHEIGHFMLQGSSKNPDTHSSHDSMGGIFKYKIIDENGNTIQPTQNVNKNNVKDIIQNIPISKD